MSNIQWNLIRYISADYAGSSVIQIHIVGFIVSIEFRLYLNRKRFDLVQKYAVTGAVNCPLNATSAFEGIVTMTAPARSGQAAYCVPQQ